MTQITYEPHSSDDPTEVAVSGIKFTAHVPVDVVDVVLAEKLAANPWFTDKPVAPPSPKRDELEHELQEIQHEIEALPPSQ